ncbi:YdcF family protein [Aestuariibaculum marinum]|uniref:YdcF family protein n=1 Tax=Aestuariibaculum marinum TaxID=2683592 RepID=A0A8J6U648_9FLAO|nr:YdcF family protein [Aestuariibaculum marinum]MBD0825462.1 YdcF family protein [Aestuariibaculum marinum]
MNLNKQSITTFLLITGAFWFSKGMMAQNNTSYYQNYLPYKSEHIIQDKVFYFFTAIQKGAEVNSLFAKDKFLNTVFKDFKSQTQHASNTCEKNIDCHLEALTWKQEQINAVSNRLQFLYGKNKSIQSFVKEHVRASGNYQNYYHLNDDSLLVNVWADAAKGLNSILNIYGRGERPLYPKIDSISYDKNTTFYKQLIDINTNSVAHDTEEMTLFFEPSLQFALNLLDINDRDEVASYEPMEEGENKRAVQYISTVNWSDYKYSVILIPGYGPEEDKVALSPVARFRLKLAVERFENKLAPFIVVSGGRVHPFRTIYNEAFEMKKELITKYGIPEESIIIEPHARHTTTNFRNTARLIYKYGIPSNKKALVTTTKYQSEYITNNNFKKRCIRDLGYVPINLGKRLNKNDVEFLPERSSLHIDVIQPLDP